MKLNFIFNTNLLKSLLAKFDEKLLLDGIWKLVGKQQV